MLGHTHTCTILCAVYRSKLCESAYQDDVTAASPMMLMCRPCWSAAAQVQLLPVEQRPCSSTTSRDTTEGVHRVPRSISLGCTSTPCVLYGLVHMCWNPAGCTAAPAAWRWQQTPHFDVHEGYAAQQSAAISSICACADTCRAMLTGDSRTCLLRSRGFVRLDA